MKELFGKAKMSQKDIFRIFGGELHDDGTWTMPLNDLTTLPVLDALMRGKR